MPKRKAVNDNSVKLVEVNELPEIETIGSAGKQIIKQFIASDMKVAEVSNFKMDGYKTQSSAITAFCNQAKRMGVKGVVRGGKVYLTR